MAPDSGVFSLIGGHSATQTFDGQTVLSIDIKRGAADAMRTNGQSIPRKMVVGRTRTNLGAVLYAPAYRAPANSGMTPWWLLVHDRFRVQLMFDDDLEESLVQNLQSRVEFSMNNVSMYVVLFDAN